MRLLAAALALTASATAQEAPPRELSTDRPDKTESPYTVDRGRVQVELDVASFTREREAGVRTDLLAVTPFNLKYGIGRDTDVQLVVEPHLRRTVRDSATGIRTRENGFGDITVRLKHNLWGNDGGKTALAVMPFVKLPSNSGTLGNDKVELGVIVPLAVELSDTVGLGLMTEIDLIEQGDGSGHAPSFVNSATLAFDLAKRLGLYTELFTERTAERGSRWVVTGDFGFTYGVTDNLQLDLGANIGLTRAADDLNIFIGVSRRF